MGYSDHGIKSEGSFTVEAALIMPLILGIIVLFIYIPMFALDRCTIEHTVRMACINAVYARCEEDAAEEYIDSHLPRDLMLRWDIETAVTSDDELISVTVDGTSGLFGKHFIHSGAAVKHFCPKY